MESLAVSKIGLLVAANEESLSLVIVLMLGQSIGICAASAVGWNSQLRRKLAERRNLHESEVPYQK